MSMKKPPYLLRVQDFKRVLKLASLDGYLLLTTLEQRYFSGLALNEGEAVFLITAKHGLHCFTKEMIATKTKTVAGLSTHVVTGDYLASALDFAVQKGLKNIAFDPACVDFHTGTKLQKANLCHAEGLVKELRQVKYADEQALLRKSCQIASQAFKEVKSQIKTGMTEEDVRILLALAMTKRGADSVAFNIVCFGENTADAHHTPSKTRKLKEGEAVLIDFGCFYEGYCSDITRSWWHGKNEPAEYARIWKIVEKARRAGIKALFDGAPAAAADAASRQVIADAGYAENFYHATGHAIGLEVHEVPFLRPSSTDILAEGMVVTVEPGIYFENKWGIRLEDSFLVTKTGSKKLT